MSVIKYSGWDKLPGGSAVGGLTDACVVLEGGAFRGLFTSGVVDALMQNGINAACTIGVSAGAMNGFNYVSGQVGRSARINLGYRHDSRYVGWRAYIHNQGIIGFDFAFGEYCKVDPFDSDTFYRPDKRFIAVSTSCNTGKPVYHEKGKCSDIFQGIRASASMPIVSKPVIVDGEPCLDGGCSVNTPYQWALNNDYKKIIIVRTRPEGFRKPPRSSKEDSLTKLAHGKYPNIVASIARSSDSYNAECEAIEALQKSGRAFVFYPSGSVEVERLEKDMEKLGALYWEGYNTALAQLEALRGYLEK